jgi:hypothetical protein
MTDSNRPIRGFYIHTESWWHEANQKILDKRNAVENIQFGLYYKDGGCDFEMAADWIKIGPGENSALEICFFEDSFLAFIEFSDVFNELARLHNRNPSKETFISVLVACGFEDLTKREREPRGRSKIRKLELED